MISSERKTILRGLGSARSPQEREWQIEHVIKPSGLYCANPVYPRLPDDNDYEGAILARQEQEQV